MEPTTLMAIATIASAGINYMGQQNSNQMSHSEAEINRGFQERMRATAHQTQMADLQAAGLNPILTATGGDGAAQPGGAQAQGLEDPGSKGMAAGLSSAMALANLEKDLDLKESQADLNHDAATKTATERGLIHENIKGQKIQNETSELQKELLRKTIPAMVKEAKAKGDYSQINQLMGVIKSGASSASDIKDLVNPLTIKTGK